MSAGTAWPDLASLELLVLVAERGSVGRAAAVVGISQASASRRLDTLERELALPLLVRTPTGSTLTPEGQVVVDWARTALTASMDLLSGVDALRRRRDASLRVAASMTVAEYLVPRWLMSFRRCAPDVEVALRVANSDSVVTLVRDEHVDVGFIESLAAPRDVSTRRVSSDRLVVVVAPGHPWARRRKPLTVDELARTRLVVREEGSGTRTTLEQLLGERRPATAPLLELTSNSAVKVAVESGVAPAVLSILAVANEVHDGRLVDVPVEGLVLARPLRAVWHPVRPLPAPATQLLRIARTESAPAR